MPPEEIPLERAAPDGPPRSAAPAVGSRLGRFEILGEAAWSAAGGVFRALDLELGREVALKVLAGGGDRERTLREARAVAALDHPAIGSLYEVGSAEPGISFLVLPLYRGRSLAAALGERGALPPGEALALLRQLASALASAHAAGIPHRGIASSNVLLLVDGGVKLLDFGIAPELAEEADSGRSRDVLALGRLGLEMLKGAAFDPAGRAVLPPGTPPSLAAVLLSCLAGDPQARPNAATLARQLAGISLAPRRRWRTATVLATAAGVALTAILAWPRPARPLLVTVLPPQVKGVLPAADAGRLAANLEATSWRALFRLEGIEALDRTLARQAPGEPAAAARATAADELIAWEADCPGGDLCSVRLSRRAADGRVLASDRLELSATGDTLAARAAAAALRRLYPGLRRKDSRPEPEPSPETYSRFLELRTALDRRELSPEAALERLDALSGDAGLPELVALEAGICRFLFARDRDPKWLVRGLAAAERGLARFAGDPVLLATRFDLLFEDRRLPAAAAALEELSRSGAGLAEVLLRSARLAEAQGRGEEALALLVRLARDRPAAQILLTLANLEQRLGRPRDARRHLEQALERSPGLAQARALLAGLDLVEGRLDAAAAGWRRLADQAPTVDALDNYGLVLLLQRRYAQAEPIFRRALELAPGHPETRLNLADTLALLGRGEEALALYRDIVAGASGPGDAGWQVRAVRAQASAHLGDREAALAELEAMRRQAPGSGEAAISAALVLTLTGDAAAALAEAQRAVAAGSGRIWFELPLFDPLGDELVRAGIRRVPSRAGAPPQG